MIPIAEADTWLKRLLSEDHDTDTAFDQTVRVSALQEAVIAYSRLRPDLYSEHVDLEYDATEKAYVLPDTYEWILSVKGFESEGKLKSLPVSTMGAITSKVGDCWDHNENGPTSIIWNTADPKHVYVDAEHDAGKDQKVIATAYKVAQNVNGNVADNSGQLNAPYSALPAIIEYALSRCYTRETAAGGLQTQHLQIFRSLVGERLDVQMNLNPLASYYYGKPNR